MIFEPGFKLCFFKHGLQPRSYTGNFCWQRLWGWIFDSEDDSSSEEDYSNATYERESVTQSEEDEEIEQKQQTSSHDEPQTEQEETSDDSTRSQTESASSQEDQQPSLKRARVGRGEVVESGGVRSEEGELGEEEAIDLEQQPV